MSSVICLPTLFPPRPFYPGPALQAPEPGHIWDSEEDHKYFHDTTTQSHDIVRRVAEGLPPATPARDAYETMRVVFAAETSADEGRSIKMDEIA